MIKKGIILLTFCLMTISYGQFNYPPLVNDFRVSDNNIPSTFQQEGTKLFPSYKFGGLYTWQDYRLGEPSYFAQRVDSLGNKIGDNFEIFSDFDLCFAPNGLFLVLKEETYSYYLGGWDGAYYTLDGKIHLDENNSLTPFNIAGGILPWCGTGWLGIHNTLEQTDSHYLNFHSYGGAVSFGKYDFSGNPVFQIIPYDSLSLYAFDIACAANKVNEYVLFSLQISPDYTTGRLFGTFFSSNDSIVSNNIPIDSLSIPFMLQQFSNLKAISIQDSMYQIFLVSSDSLVLYAWKVSRDGSIVLAQPSLQLFSSELTGNNIYRSISNYAITPMNNDNFSLIVTMNESRYPIQKDFHSLFTFDKNGNLIEAQYDSTTSLQIGKYFLRTANNSILIPSAQMGDTFQKRLAGFVTTDSIKLNNDLSGSNELSPAVHKINDDEVFISYVDEKNIIGKKIDHAGNLLTNEIILENRNLNFFSDGWSVAVWHEENPNVYSQRVGYSIYDQKFNLQSKVYLNSSQFNNTNIACLIISDSIFVVAFYDNKNLFIRSYNRSGEIRKEKLLLSDVDNYSISIYKENQNSFLVSTYQFAQLFDNELETLSPQYSRYVPYYIGSSKMLEVSTDDYQRLFGQIYNLNGSALTQKFPLASSSTDFYFNRLNNDYFAILFRVNNKIFVKSFSSLGIQIRDSVFIHSSLDGYRKSPSLTVSNNKVFFVWSDARDPNYGYDVYCSIFNLSDLTDIENESGVTKVRDFELRQNYPNPFNPSTKISWQSPVSSRQVLKVFDVLGNEVANLIDEYKPAGRHEIEFLNVERGNIPSLPTGVYFYQLIAGNFVQTKKMLILR